MRDMLVEDSEQFMENYSEEIVDVIKMINQINEDCHIIYVRFAQEYIIIPYDNSIKFITRYYVR